EEQEVVDILEFANAHLVELRYYDDLVDKELDRLYSLVNRLPKVWYPLAPGRYARVSARLSRVKLDVLEVTERIDNSLKFIDDTFFAKIYESVARELNIASWRKSLQDKLENVRSLYEIIDNRVLTIRSMLMEAAIIFLIALE